MPVPSQELPPSGSVGKTQWLTPEMILDELARYEAERGMSSAEFYERYMAGLEGDSWDAMEWSGLYELTVKKGLTPSATRS